MPQPRRPIVAISGASGFIGTILSRSLNDAGYEVLPFSRSNSTKGPSIFWNPESGAIEKKKLEGTFAVINLAGENIAGGRWTMARKQALIDSRIQSTRLLCQTFNELQSKPAVFLSASAIGYYGSSPERVFSEQDPAGSSFLSDLSKRWEAEAESARNYGIRVVSLRLGVVLGRGGGLLKRLLPVFRFGLGGKAGSGRQYMSWIAAHDLARAIAHILNHEQISGPVNLVSPQTITNAGFASTLGSVLHRPALLPLPAWTARLLLGEMADELILKDQRVSPDILLKSGFKFSFPALREALIHELAA